jgi:hypothetical protein
VVVTDRQRDEVGREDAEIRLPGVVDTIGFGFETLIARPQLILPPVLVDLYLWLGVHITSRPLILRIGDWLHDGPLSVNELAATVERRGGINIQELMVLRLPTVRVPSIISTLSSEVPYRLEIWRPAVVLPWWGVAGAAMLLLLVALVIGSEYLVALAAVTTGREASPLKRSPVETLRGAMHLVGWIGLIVAITLLFTWPVVVAALVFSFLDSGIAGWLYVALFIPFLWGVVFFFFSIQAMFVDRVGPLAALRSSYRVVRSDFWQAFGLIVAYFLVIWGFPQVWRLLISQPVGLIVAIIGHAAIGTGMIAATMVFYRDRARQLAIAGRF